MMDLMEKTIGGYELKKQIGEGATSVVYRSYQPHLERWVAVKVLEKQAKDSFPFFFQRAQGVSQLRHRNLIILYDYGEQNDRPYIVTEYVEGGTIADSVQGKPLNWIQAVDLLVPVAEGVAYAHEEGIIHTNIKSSNILIPRSDWPLLTDFDLFFKPQDNPHINRDPDFSHLPANAVAFFAPEKVFGNPLDERSDIYALGAVLFQMVTGRIPFDYSTTDEVLMAHASEQVPSLRQFNQDCPPILELVVNTAMQKSPEHRYQTMDQMVKALKDTLASSDVRPTFYKPTRPIQPMKTDLLDPARIAVDLSNTGQLNQRLNNASSARLFLINRQVNINIPDQDEVIIGRTYRGKVADVDLGPEGGANAGVSRHHARLSRQDDNWHIHDLDSLNGTYVNNVKIKPGSAPTPLRNGDEIRCGRLSLLFLTTAET